MKIRAQCFSLFTMEFHPQVVTHIARCWNIHLNVDTLFILKDGQFSIGHVLVYRRVFSQNPWNTRYDEYRIGKMRVANQPFTGGNSGKNLGAWDSGTLKNLKKHLFVVASRLRIPGRRPRISMNSTMVPWSTSQDISTVSLAGKIHKFLLPDVFSSSER